MLARAIQENPSDPRVQFYLGSAWAALGQGERAVPLLAAVLETNPRDHLARFRLAIAHELAGDPAEAGRQYQRLVDEAPAWQAPYPRFAQLAIARRQPTLAVDILRRQLGYRSDAEGLAQLALAERMAGASHAKAMARVTEALRRDPRLPAAYTYRAALLLLVDDQAGARRDFLTVLRLDPDNEQAKQAIRALGNAPRISAGAR